MIVDSHVLLWLLTGRRQLGTRAMRLVEGGAVTVSAATVWELTIKSMLGKVRVPADLDTQIEAQGFGLIDVTAAHAAAIRDYPELVRHDPFDRLLVAQAGCEGLRLLTADRALLALGRTFIVDATA